MPSSATEYLVEDHRRLHALLEQATHGGVLDVDAYEALRAGLLRHIAIEEKVLLPAAKRARQGRPIERAHELRMDHAALTSLLVPTPSVALVEEIGRLLEVHDTKEEGTAGVYAECDALVPEGEHAALLARAIAFPTIPLAPHFDGAGTVRTVAAALAAAQRLRPPRAG